MKRAGHGGLRHKDQAGFTLLELVVSLLSVIILVAVLLILRHA